MKKTFSIFALIIGCSVTLPATPVLFPLIGITGSANNRDITVIPDPATNVLIYASNLVSLQTLLIHPIRGNATNELLPWGYTMRVDGWPRAAHINVPNSTNLINVTSLITNAVALGFPVSFGGPSTNIDNATGTNVNLTGTINASSSNLVGMTITGTGPEVDLLMNASPAYANYPLHIIVSPDGFGIQFDGYYPAGSDTNYVGSVFSVDQDGQAFAYGSVYAGYADGTCFNTNAAFYDPTGKLPPANTIATNNPPRMVLTGTTNQIIFGATNSPPAGTNLVRWISVQIAGDTNVWRLGLAQ